MRISDWSSDVCSSDLLDSKMREIRGGNRMAALGRVAVLAALNFSHELQQLRNEDAGSNRQLARNLGDLPRTLDGRSEEGRVGKEGVSTCRSCWSSYPQKTNNHTIKDTTLQKKP